MVGGGMFLYMGMSKAVDPVNFLKLLRQYDLTQSSLILNSLASALPWFEAFCGLLLLTGIAVRGDRPDDFGHVAAIHLGGAPAGTAT